MAREYKVVSPDRGTIMRVYNENGLSWREAKKRLRQDYLELAADLRSMREKDAVVPVKIVSEDEAYIVPDEVVV